MSKLRPEPAPITWMIAAHSALRSMSDTEAFWTFRILPRIGSRAWKSELRASLAVPRALSPSTMNSSLRSTSSLRQAASLAGRAEVSSAFLRREISFCLRADVRAQAEGDLAPQERAGDLSPAGQARGLPQRRRRPERAVHRGR